jgi:uncharacterized protein with NAD-binding domain and iron-sulfur cluster
MKKIAVLGGGCGAMAAAFELTNDTQWQTQREVTVYQLGWRLGGKGAAGRGIDERIEEHGLHLWGGFYQNAFHMIRQCYDELGRDWKQVFKPMRRFCAHEYLDGDWDAWSSKFPHKDNGLPGDIDSHTGQPHEPVTMAYAIAHALDWLGLRIDAAQTPVEADAQKEKTLGSLRQLQTQFVAMYPTDVAEITLEPGSLLDLLDQFRRDALDFFDSIGSAFRRLRISADVIRTCTQGMVVDGVLTQGFDVIDRCELCAWMRHHGAEPETLDSALVMGGYDYVFGYPGGDTDRPSLSAGAGLRGVMRLILGYRGDIFWTMQHGMGDAVFEPLYTRLKKRGVKFEFFTRITRLEPSADNTRVEAIHFEKQVELAGADYQPLDTWQGREVWPSRPRFDQIVDGESLKHGWDQYNLETPSTRWPPVKGGSPLRLGTDFDEVVLGISLGELKTICAPLRQRIADWDRMLTHVATVPTLSCQLWFNKTMPALAWAPAKVPVITNYEQPFSTIADMEFLLDDENTRARGAKALAYFCGPMHAALVPPTATQKEADLLVQGVAATWVRDHLRVILPNATPADLVDFSLGTAEPFSTQYFRANFTPSEQYVLSLPGTAQHRLHAADSKLDNLVLAGDWTRNGLNAGCVEAAVISGVQAARKILGDTRPVPGAEDR